MQPPLATTPPPNGKDVILQTVPATAGGTYTVSVGGIAATTGEFNVRVILNAAMEEEDHDGAANDTRATAQDLTGTWTSLPFVGSSSDRAAVLGRIRGAQAREMFSSPSSQAGISPPEFEWCRTQSLLPSGVPLGCRAGTDDDLYVSMSPYSGSPELLHLDYEGNLLGTVPLPGSSLGLDVAPDGSLGDAAGCQPDSPPQWIGRFALELPLRPRVTRYDVAVRTDGQVFVTSNNIESCGVWQLDPATGNVSFFAAVNSAYGLNFTPSGELTVSSFDSGIHRFDNAGNPAAGDSDQWLRFGFAGRSAGQRLEHGTVRRLLRPDYKYDSSGTPLVSVPEGYYPYGLAVIGIDGPAPSPTLAPDPGDYYSFALTAARVRRWYSGP